MIVNEIIFRINLYRTNV